MADNVNIKDAADASVPIATDQIGGVQYPRTKYGYGADGSYTEMDEKPATEATQLLHPTLTRLGVAVAPVTTGAVSAQSGAITGTAVRVMASKKCYIVFGADPVATANDTPLAENTPEYFWITSGHKLAAIQDSEAGKVSITPVTFS